MAPEDEEEEYDVIHITNLRALARSQTSDEVQAGGEACDHLQVHLNNITRILLEQAERELDNRGGKRMEPKDINNALDEVFYPHSLLEEASAKMKEYEREIRRTANQSPVIHHERVGDE